MNDFLQLEMTLAVLRQRGRLFHFWLDPTAIESGIVQKHESKEIYEATFCLRDFILLLL